MPSALEDFWLHQENFIHVPDLTWEQAGPSNFAGRVTCLLLDPNNQSHLFAGSAAGGLWRTADGGRSWKSCWPKYLNQNIGALAIDAFDSTRMLCATGESNYSSDSYPGSGVYVTQRRGVYLDAIFDRAEEAAIWEQRRTPCCPGASGPSLSAGTRDKQIRVAFGAVSYDESLPAALYMDRGADGIAARTPVGRSRLQLPLRCCFIPPKTTYCTSHLEPRGRAERHLASQDYGKTWESWV